MGRGGPGEEDLGAFVGMPEEDCFILRAAV